MSEHGGFGHSHGAERRQGQNPEAILAGIGLKPGSTFIDIGSGDGFFALPAARMAGKTGKVYAIDINPGVIDELRQRAWQEGLTNLNTVVAEAERAVLCQGCGDIVFFGIDLHDFSDPALVLQNARQMLKPEGRLVDLDWDTIPMPMGPPLGKRFSPEYAARLIEAAGFKVETTRKEGPYHYLLVARNVPPQV